MRSNSKSVLEAINSHILENVTDYNGNTFATIKEAANHLNSEFNRVANYPYNLAKFPNKQDRFSDYLFGLPFSFHFSNYDIQNYINSLGLNSNGKSYPIEMTIRLYHYLIFSQTLKNL
jgi:hypothetical protein